MIWGILYLILLTGLLIYAERSKIPETRTAIRTLVLASVLTLIAVLSGADFETASMLLTMLDFAVLGIFVVLALTSKRYWTLCLPAFQLVTCMTHLAKFAAPGILSHVYENGQSFWAYLQMLVIFLAIWWGRAHAKMTADAAVLHRG